MSQHSLRQGRSAHVPGLVQLREPLPEDDRIDGDRHRCKRSRLKRRRRELCRLRCEGRGEEVSSRASSSREVGEHVHSTETVLGGLPS